MTHRTGKKRRVAQNRAVSSADLAGMQLLHVAFLPASYERPARSCKRVDHHDGDDVRGQKARAFARDISAKGEIATERAARSLTVVHCSSASLYPCLSLSHSF